jgi:hypothetical protein
MQRRALNENVFRKMNERVDLLGEEFGDETERTDPRS